jgi:hypothetical protein
MGVGAIAILPTLWTGKQSNAFVVANGLRRHQCSTSKLSNAQLFSRLALFPLLCCPLVRHLEASPPFSKEVYTFPPLEGQAPSFVISDAVMLLSPFKERIVS